MALALVVLGAAVLGVLASPARAGAQPTGDDAVSAHGDADFFGSTDDMTLNQPLVALAPTPTDDGYWLLARDGGVFSFGEARFHGSTGGMVLNEPVVRMAADPRGRGYWTVASDGGVFAFGAPFLGSMGGQTLNEPVVGMEATISGDGYWLVARDGGVFTFGGAGFAGSTGGVGLNEPIVDMAADPDGGGYWLLASDGGVFSFDAAFHGSAAGQLEPLDRAVAIGAHPAGGYWLATRSGSVFSFGAAPDLGDAPDDDDRETIDVAATSDGDGYWMAHRSLPPPTVVSSFTTPLVPGQDRNRNIHLAADYIDGSVIAPGERFSLNQGIGPRTSDRGFRTNGYISDGDVISVIGGGVSQMGTTFLNAAWFAGIGIEEFRQHTIYFERYPMCREATLDWNVLDVVVVNDTPHEITIDTSYTSSSVTVSFISRPWRDVDSWIGAPFNVEGTGGAFSVRCGRTVTDPFGLSSSEAYFWRYNEGYPG